MKKNQSLEALLMLIGFLILICITANAQPPGVQWEHYYGGSGFDIVSSIIQTADGGYIMAGNSNSSDGDVGPNHGYQDVWITKIDALGVIQWQKTYGGTSDDTVSSLIPTSDGGYIFAGETNSNDGDSTSNYGGADCWIVKLSNDGTIQWQKNYGGTWNDSARSIVQTSAGDYVFLGYTSSNDIDVSGNHSANGPADFWMVKINATGILQWQKCFGGFADETANSIIETSDGNFIAVGETWSTDGDVVGNHNSSSADAWVIKVNGTGNLIWQKSLGGSNSDRAQSVVESLDGNYIIGAATQSNDGDVSGHHGINTAYSDFWILALNSNGVIQWQNCLGGFADEFTSGIQKTSDGGYIMIGSTSSSDGDVTDFHGASDYWATKLNATGILQWQLALGGNGYEYANDIKQTADGGYIIAGKAVHPGQGKLANSERGGTQNDDDYWIVKLLSDPLGISNPMADSSYLKVYPNPTTDFVQIVSDEVIQTVEIFTLNGQLLYKNEQTGGFISFQNYPNGVYLIKIRSEGGSNKVFKIIKNK